jgi:hypothetical protein
MRNFCTAVLYKQVENSFRARRAKEAFYSDDAMSCAIARYLNCDFRTNKLVFCAGFLYARAPRGGKRRLNPNFAVTPPQNMRFKWAAQHGGAALGQSTIYWVQPYLLLQAYVFSTLRPA